MSKGKIGKDTFFDSDGIRSGVDQLIKQLQRIPLELANISKDIKSSGGLKELNELSKKGALLNESYNASIKKLTTSIDSHTKSMTKSGSAGKKNNKTASEGARIRERLRKVIEQNRLAQKGMTSELVKQQVKRQQLNKTLRDQARAELGIAKSSGGLRNGFKLMAAQLRNLAVAYLGVQTVIRGFQDIFKVTKTLDAIGFAQKRVIQSQVEFAQTQEFLSRIIVDYGLDLVAVTERYTKFRAATNSSNLTAIQTQKIFDSVSKASAVLGLKTDELRGVYLALEQMISKGTVTTEELRRQLGERLPGAFQIMAKALGTNTRGLNKMLRAGEVLAEEALPKFIIALEEAYGLDSVKTVDTLIAAQNRLRTAWIEFIKLMDGADFFKGVLNQLSGFVRWIGENINLLVKLGKVVINLTIIYTAYRIGLKLTTNASIRYIAVTRGITVAQAVLTIATTKVKNAFIALRAAFMTSGIGTIITLIGVAVSVLLPFIIKTKEAKEELKSFDNQVSESQKKLDLIFASLKNAAKGTNEWKLAKQEFNKTYAKYLGYIIDEKTNIEDILKLEKELKEEEEGKIRRMQYEVEISEANRSQRDREAVAISELRDRFEEYNEERKKEGKVGLTPFDIEKKIAKFKDLSRQYADGKISATGFIAGLVDTELNMIKVDRSTFELANSYKDLDDETKRITTSLFAWIKANETSKGFDLDKFKNNLKGAEKIFTKFTSLTSGDLKKWVSDNEKITIEGIKKSFTAADFGTYEKFLKELRKKYKDPQARIEIELELSRVRDKKGGDAISIQREINKQLLSEEKAMQELDLKFSIEKLQKKGASEEFMNNFIQDQRRENNIALLELEIGLSKKLLKLSKDDASAQAKIRTDIAKLYEGIAKEQSEQEIDEAKRTSEEKKRILKKEASDIETEGMDRVLSVEKTASNLINSELQRFKDREITHKEFTKNIEEIEQNLQDEILKIQIDSLKKKQLLYDQDSDEYAKISQQILNLESQKNKNIVEDDKKTAEKIAEERKLLSEKSKEFINELFNAVIASFENQLAAAEQAKNFEVALAGSNTEQRIKAERKFEKKSADIKRRQANAQKAQSAFNIITNTAQAIIGFLANPSGFPGLALSILAGSIGAIQLATVLSTPVPTFAEGGITDKDGGIIVGDKKGDKTLTKKGGSELAVLPSGKSFLTSAYPTMMDVPKGTEIIPHDMTQKMLAVEAKKSAYERHDMLKSERYLREIRDKDDITYRDGYKIVTRKNFRGVYASRI